MKSKIDELLDQLLEEIKKGRSIEDCLKEYPEYADDLEPLLRLAMSIEDLPKSEPTPEAVEVTLRRVRTMVAAQMQTKSKFSFRKVFSLQPVAMRALAVVLLICIAGFATVLLSARSLPGDTLYPVKRFCEQIQYFVTISPEGKAELHLAFADKRATEFILTFKEGEQIDRELFNALLNEKKLALECTESLLDESCRKMLEKIRKCNCQQMELLEQLKPLVVDSDTMLINEAIMSCTECGCGIERRLNQSSTEQ